MAQIPEPLRRANELGRVPMLVRTDAASATREFAARLAASGVGVLPSARTPARSYAPPTPTGRGSPVSLRTRQ
jgi:hypothetical protein